MGQPAAIAPADASRSHMDSAARPLEQGRQTVTLAIENMHCGGCMGKVERALAAVPGVVSARANLSTRRATVVLAAPDTRTDALVSALASAGFKAAELLPEATRGEDAYLKRLVASLAVAGFASANIMLLSVAVWSGASGSMDKNMQALFHWLSALIAFPAIAYAAQPFFHSAATALRAWRLNMDVPISLAIILSAGMSLYQTIRGTDQVYFDACVMLLFFLLAGRFLDQRMRTKARGAAQNLLGLKAEWAHVIGEDGHAERLPARLLEAGMRLSVAAGDRFPADGIVVAGASEIDESLITGETTPRALGPGDMVYAGALNLGGPVEMRVTARDKDSLLSQIVRLMEAAEQSRGLYVRLADRAARLYSPFVHLLALATFAGWMLAGAGWEDALTIAIAVLIITCPCALALAVPAVQVAASSRLFAKGVLVKAHDGLERLAEIDTVVFDKTGTLTYGVPRLVNGEDISDRTLRDAAALASASRHPYAAAVVAAARERFGAVALADGVEERPGFGLRLVVEAGERRLGSAIWCEVPPARGEDASLWYRSEDGALAAFRFEDRLRTDAGEAVAALKRAGFAIEILSGDREETVATAARAVGVDCWRARTTPPEKIARLAALKAEGRRVLMVGDGLNDAPALAAAHASLSPSSAAAISQTAADAVFQGDRLAPVIETLATARKSVSMSRQNFMIAGIYNVMFVPLAIAGHVTPLIAAIAMSTSSILVTANALRLRGMRLELRR